MEVPTKPKRRWWSVLALSAAAFVDSSEDSTLSILWPQMRQTLGLSVGQLGPVLGISGAIRTVTLPLWGYAADRMSRKALLVGITGVWGLWTLAVAFVHNLPQLVAVRVLSALGLGVLWPAAFSLLSDLFGSRERGRAAGVMTAVSFTGSISAFGILPMLAAQGPEAWRNGFIVMGLASLVTGLLMLGLNDPPRGAAEPEMEGIAEKASERYAFRLADLRVVARVRSWWVLLVSNAFDSLSMGLLYGWSFTWLDSIGLGASAFMTVALMATGNLVGHLLFGFLGDALERRFQRHGRTAMATVGLAATAPLLAGFIYAGSYNQTLLLPLGLLTGIGLSSVDTGARWPMAQAVLRPELRATGRAALDMVLGLAAALAMSLSGHLANQVGVGAMLLLLVPAPKLIAALAWLPMYRTYPRDRAALHEVLAERRQELLGT